MNPVLLDESKEYFSKTLKRLRVVGKGNRMFNRSSFANLKMMEYWVRLLRIYPNGRCNSFFKFFFDREQWIEFIKLLAREYLNLPALEKIQVFHERKNYSIPEIIRLFMESGDTAYADSVIVTLQCNDSIPEIAEAMIEVAENFARERIRRGCGDDVSMRNAFDLKRTFGLSDEALELVLYLWLKDNKNMFFSLSRNFSHAADPSFDCNNRGSLQRIMEATGLGAETINRLCDRESPLRKFQIIATESKNDPVESRTGVKRTELYLAKDISDYLYGYAGNEKILNFGEAGAPRVSFERLAAENPAANFVFLFLHNRKNGSEKHPLHILFYGREGTGKTELAKSVAAKLGTRLLNVGVGDENMDNETRLHHRIRSLLMADYECKKSGGFILMDEADQVLNQSEKGFLNILFESIETPVIWIANSVECVAGSTRRRFHYALEFNDFGKAWRESIWKSVLKTQGAEDLLSDDQIRIFAAEIPIMAGSVTQSVLLAKSCGANAEKVVREVALSHARLLNIPCSAEKAGSNEENYDASLVHFEGDALEIDPFETLLQNFNEKWSKGGVGKENLNILLYGPPGTGKTAFVGFVASFLGRELVVKRGSDLFGKYVGDTEKNICRAFREAETAKAVLFLDEADGLLENRECADRHWEVTKVNEFVCRMDDFNGLFMAATNHFQMLDPAVRRRFHLKIGFGYMTPAQIEKAWKKFFLPLLSGESREDCPAEVLRQSRVSVGDFATVKRLCRYMPVETLNGGVLQRMLLDEVLAKEARSERKMGF